MEWEFVGLGHSSLPLYVVATVEVTWTEVPIVTLKFAFVAIPVVLHVTHVFLVRGVPAIEGRSESL